MSTPSPDTMAGAVIYKSRRRQWLIVAGMVGLLLLLWSQTQQPDYETGIKPEFSRYIWELAPFVALTLVMAVRAFRVRLVTTPDGVHVYRVLTHRYVPWEDVAGVEVHPSPTGMLSVVKLRLETRRTVTVSHFGRRRRQDGHSPEAEALAQRLRADRQARLDGFPVGR